MSELKPCPFCGGRAEMVSLKGITAKYIECTNCKISTEVISDDKILFEIWNRRTNNAKTD